MLHHRGMFTRSGSPFLFDTNDERECRTDTHRPAKSESSRLLTLHILGGHFTTENTIEVQILLRGIPPAPQRERFFISKHFLTPCHRAGLRIAHVPDHAQMAIWYATAVGAVTDPAQFFRIAGLHARTWRRKPTSFRRSLDGDRRGPAKDAGKTAEGLQQDKRFRLHRASARLNELLGRRR